MTKFIVDVDTAVGLLRCHQKPRRYAIFVMFYNSSSGGISHIISLVSEFKAHPLLSTIYISVSVDSSWRMNHQQMSIIFAMIQF
jgi:hypothetical protein